jgi:hypothetical protein
MKWDHSHRNIEGDIVREAYFQDEVSAQTLRDYRGSELLFFEEGHVNEPLAEAQRVSTPYPGWKITLHQGADQASTTTYRKRKDDAIDVMLGVN